MVLGFLGILGKGRDQEIPSTAKRRDSEIPPTEELNAPNFNAKKRLT